MASVDTQSRTPGALAVWIGVWTGPVAWTIHLVVCYLLVPFACATGYTWVFHLTTATTGAATLLAGVLAYRAWQRSQVGMETDASDWTGIDRLVRRRGFMGLIGVFLSAIFFLLIIMEAAGTFVLSPCQYRQYGGQTIPNPPPVERVLTWNGPLEIEGLIHGT